MANPRNATTGLKMRHGLAPPKTENRQSTMLKKNKLLPLPASLFLSMYFVKFNIVKTIYIDREKKQGVEKFIYYNLLIYNHLRKTKIFPS